MNKPDNADVQFRTFVERENRIGRFQIPKTIIRNHYDLVLKEVFARVFIVRAEYMYHREGMEYLGYSELFEPSSPCDTAPEYDLQFSLHQDPKTKKRTVTFTGVKKVKYENERTIIS